LEGSNHTGGSKVNDAWSGFSLRFASTTQLYQVLKPLTSINTTLVVSLRDDFLEAKCISPSHVSMAILVIPKEAFAEYSVNGQTSFAFELEGLLTALRTVGESWIRLFSEGEPSDAGGILAAEFREGSMRWGLDSPATPIPDLRVEFDVESLLLLDELRDQVAHAYSGGCSRVTFNTRGDAFSVGCAGLMKRFSPIWIRYKTDAVDVSYSLAELRSMLITSRNLRVVRVSFGNDKPLSLHYTVPLSYTLRAATIKYFLAPEQPAE